MSTSTYCLLEVLGALVRKDKGLLFVDTHAGRGDYDLHPGDAEHPSEWQSGAARVLAAAPRHAALLNYRRTDRGWRTWREPALSRARRCWRCACCARSIARFSSKPNATKRDSCARRWKVPRARAWKAATASKGCARCCRPPERRGCVLIDPPYEERADFARVHDAAVDALQRFPTGVLLSWLPLKLRADFDRWFTSLRRGARTAAARFAAVAASARFTRRAQWLGTGDRQSALST